MRKAFALLAFLVVTSAVFADQPDLWLTPPHASDDDGTWMRLDGDRFITLPAGQDAAALKLLALHKIVVLNCKTFVKVLPGTPCPHDADRKPYLVRAIEMLQSLGSIRVDQRGDDIDVNYNGPIEPGEIRHRAVILYLPAPPKHLSVSITLYS